MNKINLIAASLWILAIIGVGFGSFTKFLAPPAAYHLDLYIHFAAYAFLAGLPMFVTQDFKWRSSFVVLIIAFGLGAEWIQSFIPGRSPSIDDAVINLIGICLGATVAGALSHRLSWHLATIDRVDPRKSHSVT